jgi:hypothetical protein
MTRRETDIRKLWFRRDDESGRNEGEELKEINKENGNIRDHVHRLPFLL